MNGKNTAITSAAIGVAVGAAAYMLSGTGGKKLGRKTRKLRKTAGKTLRQASDFISGMSYIVK